MKNTAFPRFQLEYEGPVPQQRAGNVPLPQIQLPAPEKPSDLDSKASDSHQELPRFLLEYERSVPQQRAGNIPLPQIQRPIPEKQVVLDLGSRRTGSLPISIIPKCVVCRRE